ncbi:MAG: BtpA/SgcQ family protein [Deltaproteobacteria bacterium]|nr:BtpA/SgcQ family protein [Deltaproteobacteria bacterium]
MIPTGLVGVVHLRALPGDPGYDGKGIEAVYEAALADARAIAEGGGDAIIVENFGSAPFVKGTRGDRIPAHQAAALAIVVRAAKALGLPVGVNCLRNDAITALGIAVATSADFIRVNVHAGAYVTDQGVIEGEAAASLRYRAALGARNVAILADVLVKHASPLVALDAATATRECLGRGGADAVIVTGAATGAPVDGALLEDVRDAAGGAPVFIGSGLTPDRADALRGLFDAAIVGTWIKEDGVLDAPVDAARVARLAATLGAHD